VDILDAIGTRRRHLREARVGKSDGQHERPHGAGGDRPRGKGRAAETGRHGRRIHGRSTGASIALVCAAKGYRLQIVTSDAFSQQKRDHMATLPGS
jgi:hypothetical protein